MVMPSPRPGELPPAGMDASTWQVLSTLGELREDIRGIGSRMDRLPADFVTRNEYNAHAAGSESDRAELRSMLTAETGHREDAIRRVDERITAEARERANDRKWALGLLATILVAISGEGVTLFTHFH